MGARAESAERRSLPGRKTPVRSAKANDEHQAAQAGLDLLRVLGWLVLHDAAVAGDPDAVADHVVVGPSGVYVVNNAPWPGAVTFANGRMVAGGVSRTEEVDQVAAVAEAMRTRLGHHPVAAVLCLVHGEPVTGVAGEVAVCSTENILDLLTQLPAVFDAATQQQVARVVGRIVAPTRPRTPAPTVVVAEAPPAKHRSKGRRIRRRAAEEEIAAAVEIQVPVTEVPVTEAPATELPSTELPVAELPVTELPAAEAPLAAPVVAAPPVEKRVVETVVAPPVEAPVVQQPVVEAPVAEAPVVEAPVVEAPRPVRAPAAPDRAPEQARAESERRPADERAAEERRVADERRLNDERRAAEERQAAVLRAAEERRAQDLRAVEAERARVAEERARVAAELQMAAAEREQAAAEHRQIRDEHHRVEIERRQAADERERVAAERARVGEERRQAERAQAQAVAERKRAIEERRHADEARAKAEAEARRAAREREAAEKAAAKRVAADRAAAARIEAARQAEAAAAAVHAPRPVDKHAMAPVAPPTQQPAARVKTKANGVRGLLPALLSAVVVVLVISVVPRVPHVVAWGKGLFTAAPAPAFGTTIPLEASTFHPALRITAASPTVTQPARGTAAAGTHLVAVPLTLRNDGISKWSLPLGSRVVAVDSLGVEHRPAHVAAVRAGKLLPASFTLGGERVLSGVVAFAVENGRTLTEVQVTLDGSGEETVTWAVPSGE